MKSMTTAAARFLGVTLLMPWILVGQQLAVPPLTAAERAHLKIAGMFDIEVAQRYEKLHRWKEAEQEYLAAGHNGAVCVKKMALDGIRRIEPYRPADDAPGFEFDLAEFYASQGDWKNAEQHYAAAGKDALPTVKAAAIAAVRKVYEHQEFQHQVEDFDRWAGYLARLLGLFLVPLILYGIVQVWSAIRCEPFLAPREEDSRRIGFSLADTREMLPDLMAPLMKATRANVIDILPLIILPGLDGKFGEPIEDLEVGEAKLPIGKWAAILRRPKVKIEGRWNVGGTMGSAHARIALRAGFFWFRERRVCQAPVASAAGDLQELDLMLFSCDVLVKAVYTFYGV